METLPPPSGRPEEPPLEAMWVWNTAEILSDPVERGRFLDFVADRGIDRVFLYLAAAEGERPAAGHIPFDSDRLGPLLAELRARGALTYALDGDPNYVRDENRPGILRTVRALAAHNRSRPPEERFHGVRYDVEPYLLPGFQSPRRIEILSAYVEMLADIAEEAHAGGLVVGADIPFWFDAGDEHTGEPFEAILTGERRPVLEHVMATVDDVAIMAYRTSARGGDGAIMHSWAELEEGRTRGTDVFVGLETTRLFDESLYAFRGAARLGVPPMPEAAWILMEDLGGGRVRIWLANGADALAALERDTPDMDALRYWHAGQPVQLPGDHLSFHSLGWDAMENVAGEIVEQFSAAPAFVGLAFHDYLGLRALRARR
jgi:hypothetical protein